jgi:hypothetical protein
MDDLYKLGSHLKHGRDKRFGSGKAFGVALELLKGLSLGVTTPKSSRGDNNVARFDRNVGDETELTLSMLIGHNSGEIGSEQHNQTPLRTCYSLQLYLVQLSFQNDKEKKEN